MAENKPLEDLFQQIRDICAKEYKRGEDDAIARIMKAAAPEKVVEKPREIAARVTKTNVRKEPKKSGLVPRGIPEQFVRRVMSKVTDGISPTAIHEHAETPLERRIAYATIRGALKRGRQAGEYRNEGGKWYLASREYR